MTLRSHENAINPKLYIYEIEKDVLRYFNFAAGQNDAEDVSVPPNSAQSHIPASMQPPQPPPHSNTHVVNHSWDANEVNFLACHTTKQAKLYIYSKYSKHQIYFLASTNNISWLKSWAIYFTFHGFLVKIHSKLD